MKELIYNERTCLPMDFTGQVTFIDDDGLLTSKQIFRNGLLHSVNEPAMTELGSTEEVIAKSWYCEGERHREDGPAYFQHNNDGHGNTLWKGLTGNVGMEYYTEELMVTYYLNGELVTKEAHELHYMLKYKKLYDGV